MRIVKSSLLQSLHGISLQLLKKEKIVFLMRGNGALITFTETLDKEVEVSFHSTAW